MPRLLDLFCGAGGAAMGYHRAGFDEIVGVDIKPQPHYPFTFVQGDAMTHDLRGFDAVHASPPCQRWSEATPLASRHKHPDLIADTRTRLVKNGKPFVIENVDGARRQLLYPLMLCGTMFGLKVWRHRHFECSWWDDVFRSPLTVCRHIGHPVVVSGSAHGRGEASVAEMIEAVDVPWMKVRAEVRQAIPPAYTEFIGRQLLDQAEMSA